MRLKVLLVRIVSFPNEISIQLCAIKRKINSIADLEFFTISIQLCAIKSPRHSRLHCLHSISIQLCAIKSLMLMMRKVRKRRFQFNFVRLKVRGHYWTKDMEKFQFNFVRLKADGSMEAVNGKFTFQFNFVRLKVPLGSTRIRG